jgi:hypothetical protein
MRVLFRKKRQCNNDNAQFYLSVAFLQQVLGKELAQQWQVRGFLLMTLQQHQSAMFAFGFDLVVSLW